MQIPPWQHRGGLALGSNAVLAGQQVSVEVSHDPSVPQSASEVHVPATPQTPAMHTWGKLQSVSTLHVVGPAARAGQLEVPEPLKIGLWSWMLPPCRNPDAWYPDRSGTRIEKKSVFLPPLSVTATAQLTSADVWLVRAVPQIKRVAGGWPDGLGLHCVGRSDGSGLSQAKYPVMVVQ